MKIIFGLIFYFVFPSIVISQQLIQIDSKDKNEVNYLIFKSDSCSSVFIDNLNKYFGYINSLVEQYRQAPNFYDRKSTKGIIGVIDSIRNGKIDGSLAEIGYEVQCNDNFLLSISKIVVPEGKKRYSNSTVSDYPYVFPKNYDLKHQKEIKSVNTFLTKAGIISIQNTIKAVMCKRAKLYYQFRTDSSCRIGITSLSEYMSNNYAISNNSSDLDIYGAKEKLFFFYYFSTRGLEFGNNNLAIESVVCGGPYDQITIPWIDLLPNCLNSEDNIVLQKCNIIVANIEKSDWIVKDEFVNLLETPNDLGIDTLVQVKPYIIKGEKVSALAICDDFLKVSYSSTNGKITTGWVPASSLKKINTEMQK